MEKRRIPSFWLILSKHWSRDRPELFLTLFLTSQPRTEGPRAERVPSPTPSSLIGQQPSALGIGRDTEIEAYDYHDFVVGFEVCEGYKVEPDFFLDETIDGRWISLNLSSTRHGIENRFPCSSYFASTKWIPEGPLCSKVTVWLGNPSTAKEGQRDSNVDFPFYKFLKIPFSES